MLAGRKTIERPRLPISYVAPIVLRQASCAMRGTQDQEPFSIGAGCPCAFAILGLVAEVVSSDPAVTTVNDVFDPALLRPFCDSLSARNHADHVDAGVSKARGAGFSDFLMCCRAQRRQRGLWV